MTENVLSRGYSQDQFNKYIIGAVIFHCVVILLFWLISVLLGWDFFHNIKTKNELKIIQSSVRVDVIGMPKYTVQELKKMKISPSSPTEAEKTQKAAPVKDNEKDELTFKKKGKKVNLGSLLSKFSQKKVGKSKTTRTKQKENVFQNNKRLKSLILEGNKISKGTSVVGDSYAQQEGVFNEYVSALPDFIRPHWRLPTYLKEGGYKCRIRVYIGTNGKILKTEIFESSGLDEYDRKALTALRQADPLPAPKSEILTRVTAGEVILGFPL